MIAYKIFIGFLLYQLVIHRQILLKTCDITVPSVWKRKRISQGEILENYYEGKMNEGIAIHFWRY